MNSLEVLKLQKEAITDLQANVSNHAKTQTIRKTQQYYERKIVRLDDWWFSFLRRHDDLLISPDPDQPYFKNNSFDSSKNVYNEFRAKLREELNEVTGGTYDDDDFVPQSGDNGGSSATQNETSTNEQQSAQSSAQSSAHLPSNSNANVSTSIALIVNVLREDATALLDEINGITGDETKGYAKANSDLLRETWTTFKNKYYEARAMGIQITFNLLAIQANYTTAMGRLNDMITPKSTNEEFKLPKNKLPDFNGKQSEWVTYIQLFDKMVHNTELDDSWEMQQLKTSLRSQNRSEYGTNCGKL